jgi:hypothetical protein
MVKNLWWACCCCQENSVLFCSGLSFTLDLAHLQAAAYVVESVRESQKERLLYQTMRSDFLLRKKEYTYTVSSTGKPRLHGTNGPNETDVGPWARGAAFRRPNQVASFHHQRRMETWAFQLDSVLASHTTISAFVLSQAARTARSNSSAARCNYKESSSRAWPWPLPPPSRKTRLACVISLLGKILQQLASAVAKVWLPG